MVMLNEEGMAAIAAAVAAEETHTTGEIAVVVTPQSSTYRELSLSVAAAIAVSLPWLAALHWHWPLFPHLWLTQAATFLLVESLLQPVAARLAPSTLTARRCAATAREQFLRLGLQRTAGQNGVMLYLSGQEHYAEILADSGLDGQVSPEEWQSVLQPLLRALRQGEAGAGMEQAVRGIGALLRRHHPAQGDAVDELPDTITLS